MNTLKSFQRTATGRNMFECCQYFSLTSDHSDIPGRRMDRALKNFLIMPMTASNNDDVDRWSKRNLIKYRSVLGCNCFHRFGKPLLIGKRRAIVNNRYTKTDGSGKSTHIFGNMSPPKNDQRRTSGNWFNNKLVFTESHTLNFVSMRCFLCQLIDIYRYRSDRSLNLRCRYLFVDNKFFFNYFIRFDHSNEK